MKIFVRAIKYSALLTFVGIVGLTIAAYLQLPVPTKPLVVQTGSMAPSIPAGSLVVIAKSETDGAGVNYVENDVITFEQNSSLVSHRVVSVVRENGEKFFQTKGDANQTADPELVADKQVVGKVIFAAPFVGKLVSFVKQPVGFFLLVAVPTLFIIISELLVIVGEIRKKPQKKSSNLNIYKPITLTVMCLVFVGTSFSYFSDAANSTNNIFTSAPIFTNHVVISEVQTKGSDGVATKDFVEFYNPTSIPFDLNGHRLVRRNETALVDTTVKSWTSSAIIPAHGYYLWASSTGGYGATIGADTTTTLNFGNDSSVALRFGAENTGTIIDAVSWFSAASTLKEGTVFSSAPGNGQSLERKALPTSTSISMLAADALKGNGSDSNDNSVDFTLRTVSQPQNSTSATESP